MKKFLVALIAIGLMAGLAIPSKAVEFAESVKVNGLMQFWYENEQGATVTDTFRLRRAEIKLSGEITPEVSWAVMIDPAAVREDDTKTETVNGTKVITSVGRKSPLQDFVITLKPHKSWNIDFGQYKVPFGMEGLESSAKLDFIERSAITSQFKWADYRDIGVTLKGDFNSNGVKVQSALGIFNGEGQNKSDANNSSDFAGRLVIKPTEGLHLGVATYRGKVGTSSTDNTRTGGEIKLAKGPVTAYGEYVTGKSDGKDKKTYYLAGGYKITEALQVVARYDWYDPDTNTSDDDKTETTIGLNYFLAKHNAKAQLNYVFRDETPSVTNNVLRANIQISY